METIGEHLKRVRKTCGYSLDDVARVTKINLRYLEAIENGEFSKLPGETFLQGFIRSYARFLGINEQEIINKFKERKMSETSSLDIHRGEEDRGKHLSIIRKNIRIILPIGIGFIALLTTVIFLVSDRETSSIQNSKEVKDISAVPVEIKPVQAIQPVIEPLSLKIQAKELTWIRAKIDERELKEVLLKPGEKIVWNGEEKVIITLGNAGGVEMEINGKRQELLGKRGEVVRNIVITSSGIMSPPSPIPLP